MDLLVERIALALEGEPRRDVARLPAPKSPGVATPQIASPAPSRSKSTDRPAALVSSLPTEDPDFYEIAMMFAERLEERLDAMRSAWSEGDLDELAKLAHWLKGSGGTAGFHAFTAPAAELELLAKSSQSDQIEGAIAGLAELADRIVMPEPPASVGA
jgi:HPt (histidine-containing phosphotransfer) domain-containing protein